MAWYDWLIMIVPMVFVMGMGFWSRRYIKGVSDYLAAGRVAGRYVLSVGDVALALGVITMIGYVEAQYKAGFAMVFWTNVTLPLGVVIGLTGFFTYRFRETKAMSLGQFLEMRYNRPLRVYAAALRSVAELIANCMCPAIAARFLIYYIGLPGKFELFGFEIPTFLVITFISVAMCVIVCCVGGALSLLVTDTIQGFFCYPLLILFILFVLFKYPWDGVVMPVMLDRVSGESFVNPYDVSRIRDFNVFALVVTIYSIIINRGNWMGTSSGIAAKTPHEQKMAGILGTWRGMLCSSLNVVLVLLVIATLSHHSLRDKAKAIRDDLSRMVLAEVQADNPALQKKINDKLTAMSARDNLVKGDVSNEMKVNKKGVHYIPRKQIDPAKVTLPERVLRTQHEKDSVTANVEFSVDDKEVRWKLSHDENLDTQHLTVVRREFGDTPEGNFKFQEFNTLYHQMMLPVAMKNILPAGMIGLFALFVLLMMLSTDDTRLFSAAQTIAQDCILPFMKDGVSVKTHVFIIRIVVVFCGLVWLIGSFFMAQLDYINMFVTIICSMWIGAGPIMFFGLYSRFGNTKGAFTSLISGMVLALTFIYLQRNWADTVYPFLVANGWDGAVGNFLAACSGPFEPWIMWRINGYKFPINSTEINFIIMIICLLGYILVSLLTYRGPFNLDRMLHRGIYDTENKGNIKEKWTFSNIFRKMIGITPEFTRGDKIISWSVFGYSIVYHFFLAFIVVLIWNFFHRWPDSWWGYYFYIICVIIPVFGGLVAAVWLITGGVIDLKKLFKDLKERVDDPLDNGQVKGNVSLSDIATFEKAEEEQENDKK